MPNRSSSATNLSGCVRPENSSLMTVTPTGQRRVPLQSVSARKGQSGLDGFGSPAWSLGSSIPSCKTMDRAMDSPPLSLNGFARFATATGFCAPRLSNTKPWMGRRTKTCPRRVFSARSQRLPATRQRGGLACNRPRSVPLTSHVFRGRTQQHPCQTKCGRRPKTTPAASRDGCCSGN